MNKSAIVGALWAIAVSAPSLAQPVDAVRVASGLSAPLYLTHAPGDERRVFVVEQRGRIKIVDLASGSATLFLNISDRVSQTGNERGLLGLAFHPDYENNGLFYVDYTRTQAGRHPTVIAQFSAIDDNAADPNSEVMIATWAQDFDNHNGGWIGFGPDGYLYIGAGDGGSGNDPNQRAQDLGQMLGKIHRINVDGDDFPADPQRNYAIPADNPFVGVGGAREEIWAYGIRNPWRNSFDAATGDFYIGDVGQDFREEVDFQPAASPGGENYGWRCYEGNRTNITTGDCDPLPSPVVSPIHEYTHGGSPFRCSITGGYVYRGCSMPALDGTYFFADYCSNQVWSFRYDGSTMTDFTDRTSQLTPPVGSIGSITSFGVDSRGELYIVDQGGEIFRIIDPAEQDINHNNIADVCECVADVDGDGDVDGEDFFGFLDQFASGDQGADLDGDGDRDANDFFLYLDLFEAGC